MTRNLSAWPALLACGLAGLLAAGCSSSTAPPSWASALGSGVTVDAPAQVLPGEVIQGVFAAIGSCIQISGHWYLYTPSS